MEGIAGFSVKQKDAYIQVDADRIEQNEQRPDTSGFATQRLIKPLDMPHLADGFKFPKINA
jgi:hypothetical protein